MADPFGVMLISGTHDRVHMAFMVAAAAAALGRDVTLFASNAGCRGLLTDWGSLRDAERDIAVQARGVPGLDILRQATVELAVRMIACETGLRAEAIDPAALLPGVQVAGLATFLSAVAAGQDRDLLKGLTGRGATRQSGQMARILVLAAAMAVLPLSCWVTSCWATTPDRQHHLAKPVPVVHPPHAPAHPAAATPPAPTPPPAPAPPSEPAKGSNTGLPLPRFASLKTDEVNLRSGPGVRYPIDWVYKRHDLPVEIQREFEVWRLVADPEGVKGWVHQATLVGRRTFVVTQTEQTMHEDAAPQSSPVAKLKPGVIGRIRSCEATADYCQVQVGDYRGWLKRDGFWGSYKGEAIQ